MKEEEELTISQALNIAVKYHNKGELNEAEFIYRKVIEKNPNNSDAWHLLGLVEYQRGKYKNAIKKIGKAIQLNPAPAIYYGNLGMVYDASGNEEESIKNFEKALEINPAYDNAYLAYYNLGISLKDKGKITEALEHFNKSIKLNQEFPDAHWNRSLILLLLGRFEEGWKEYEYRFKKKSPTDPRIFNKPQWTGSSLQGKKILVVSEQGAGDNIQFIRYLPFVKEKGGHIILECPKDLKRLFESIPYIDEFIEKKQNIVPNIEFDCYIHLMSLPRIFSTDISTIPNKIPYLKANCELNKDIKEKINTPKFKIGINWAGNPNQDNDKNRSTTLEKFMCLKQVPGITLFSLQKGIASKQLSDPSIINLEGSIKDFADLAFMIGNLDLVISVDTSVAHLAGAVGKPIWTLLSFNSDWRWLTDRNDTPWYPNMKLFRQKKPGDWDFLFNDVVKELGNVVKLPN